jgi:hypothetical protein
MGHREIGPKRYENLQHVHRVVDKWRRETRADVAKANIRSKRSMIKAAEYSAFACRSVMG